MKAKTLANVLSPFRLVCDPDSVVPAYRSINLTDGYLVSHTGWAKLEAKADLGIEADLALPGRALFSIASALPNGDQEVEFKSNGNTLEWKAGSAKGKFATLPGEPPAPLGRSGSGTTLSSEGLAEALECGALSCGNPAMASFGMNGMSVHGDGASLEFISCDNVTISYFVHTAGKTDKGLWTLSPKGAELLSLLCKTHPGTLRFLDKEVWYFGEGIKAIVALVAPLKTDLLKLISTYDGADIKVPLPKEAIAAFIKRSQGLAEVRQQCFVELSVGGGCILLKFNEEASQTEEFFLAENLPKDFECSITVDAIRLARALSHCDKVVLDHLDRKTIIFEGGKYTYLVSGKGES